MTSLRELIGRVKTIDTDVPQVAWPGNVSLLQDFWCYSCLPGESQLSLRWQIRLIEKRHFHLNLIRVGDNLTTDDRNRTINGAAHGLREIYGAVGIGVVRIQHHAISTAAANGREVIDSHEESEALTNEWTVHNDGLDIFLVAKSWPNDDEGVVTGGRSAVNGSCDKDYAKTMTGCVVTTNDGLPATGLVMAHEVGHYLGLPHRPPKTIGEVVEADLTTENINNLMFPLQIGRSEITDDQLQIIKDHCFVH